MARHEIPLPLAPPRAEEQAPNRYPLLDAAMERYALGDDAAFAVLHDGLAPRLRSFLLRLCGDPALASDLAQETFLRVHRARGTFEEGAAVVPWVLSIARNVLRDHLRRRVRAPRVDPLSEDVERVAGGTPPTAPGESESLAVAKDTAAIVRDALAVMPASHREAFILLRFEGLSVAEAAEVLGATKQAVKLRAFRAYEAIRAALRRSEEGGGAS